MPDPSRCFKSHCFFPEDCSPVKDASPQGCVPARTAEACPALHRIPQPWGRGRTGSRGAGIPTRHSAFLQPARPLYPRWARAGGRSRCPDPREHREHGPGKRRGAKPGAVGAAAPAAVRAPPRWERPPRSVPPAGPAPARARPVPPGHWLRPRARPAPRPRPRAHISGSGGSAGPRRRRHRGCKMPRSFLVKKHFSASKKPNYSELESQAGAWTGRARGALRGWGGGSGAGSP